MIEKLIDLLYEDLEGMVKFFISKEPLPPSHVRIVASSILRKWLIEGLINKLASLNGMRFTFVAPDTSIVVESVSKNPNITFYVSGGILLDGQICQGIYASDSPPPKDGRPELPKTELRHFTLTEFLRSKRVYFKNRWFDVESILRFVANKAGGVHFDTKREKEWQMLLEEASNYFVAGNPGNLDKAQIIEPYSDKHQILMVLPKEKGIKWNCLDIEMLSAAQAFCRIHVDGESIITLKGD